MKTIRWSSLVIGMFAVLSLATVVQADNPTFEYETLLPGYYLAHGNDMTVDAAGNAYVIASWYQDEHSLDILIFKLDPEGNLLWTLPIIGDSGKHDYATDIILDSGNNIWVTGWTSSASFPVTPDAFDNTLTVTDAFLLEVSSVDGSILYGTFLGGDYTDRGQGIDISASGDIYLVGTSGSTDFPTTPDAYQGEPSAPLYLYTDAFISRFSADGKTLLYSTYFGGYEDDWGEHVRVDQNGEIVFSGSTSADDFPLVNPIQSSPDGMFISKLSADGSTLLFSTYLGGSDVDLLRAMDMDAEGNVYITGYTRSVNFPTTPGAFQQYFVGEILGCEEGFPPHDVNCDDGFLTKLRTDGTGIVYGTFLGGSTIDKAHNIVVDDTGCAYVVGYTNSPDFLGSGNSYASIFVVKISDTGSDLDYVVTRESPSAGSGHGVAVDALRDAYFTGAANVPYDIYTAKLAGGSTPPDLTVSISSAMTQVPRFSNFLFDVQITNNESTLRTLRGWTAGQKLPDGSIFEPFLGPVTFTLKPGETKSFYNIRQYIGRAPVATYRYYTRIGADFPGLLFDEDYLDVEVIP